MGIKVTGGVKVPQGKFSVYTPPPPPVYTLWGWGNGRYGYTAHGNVTDYSSPVQVGVLTDWGTTMDFTTHAIAIKPDGTLWAWGQNNHGKTGYGTDFPTIRDIRSPLQIGSQSNWAKISLGTLTSHAIKTDGSMWAWGGGLGGKLAHGNVTNYSSPVQVGSLTDWAVVAETKALKTDGSLWSWSYNNSGNVGDGTDIYRSSPVQIGSLTDWSSISGGSGTTLALKTNGGLWGWGRNTEGQLGLNDTDNRSSPIQIGSDTNWASVNVSNGSMAIKTDGTLWAWGNNLNGQLGLGDAGASSYRSSPVQVGNLSDWAHIDGAATRVAVKTDGTIWVWGNTDQGAAADGFNVDTSSPVQVGSDTDWVSAQAYGSSVLAIRKG